MADRKPHKEIVDPVTVQVNGEEIVAERGELLIEACERNGEYIPRFCHHSRMNPVGMCRMCLVDVDTGRGSALQPSCMVECGDGMVVDTQNEGVQKAQNGVLEFLLTNHPLDCPVCDKGGECPLQDHTMSFGPGESRMVEEKRHFTKPISISETVNLDRERCILCDRCTRFADEVAGDPLIHFIDRGSQTQVNIFPDEPFASYFSGNTVQICPVGALTAKPYRFKARPWDLTEVESTCTTCSVGCRISVDSSRDEVLRYNGVDADPVNWGWLCDKGRFGFEAVNSADRLTAPLEKASTGLAAISWADALEDAAELIKKGADRDPNSVAVIGGSNLTNESAYVWARLAKAVVGTDHVDAQMGDGLDANLIANLPRATIDEVCAPGGTIIYLGPDPKEELGVLYLRLRHAVTNDDAKLIELAPRLSGLSPYATAAITYAPGEAAASAAAIMGVGGTDDELIGRAQAIIAAADGPVSVVLGRPSLAESAATIHAAASAILNAKPDAKFLLAVRGGNTMGAIDMGLAPGLLPGRRPLGDPTEELVQRWGSVPSVAGLDTAGILTAAAEGKIETLILLGADPITDFPDSALASRALTGARNVIAIDCFLNESVKRADLVLPCAVAPEVGGTTTNMEGRVTTLAAAVTPRAGARADWEIAVSLSGSLGSPFDYESPADIWDEVATVSTIHAEASTAVLAGEAAVDGVVTTSSASASFDADVGATIAAPKDGYGIRLVATKSAYGNGTMLANSPSSSGLATKTVLALNPGDFEKAGLGSSTRVKMVSANGSVSLNAVADDSMPRGVGHVLINQSDVDIGAVIDANATVTDVRLEAAT